MFVLIQPSRTLKNYINFRRLICLFHQCWNCDIFTNFGRNSSLIQFYRKAQITGQQMHEDVKQHQAKLARQPWGTCFPHCCSCGEFPSCSFSKQLTNNVGMILFILLLYGLIGFLDDFLKVFRKSMRG